MTLSLKHNSLQSPQCCPNMALLMSARVSHIRALHHVSAGFQRAEVKCSHLLPPRSPARSYINAAGRGDRFSTTAAGQANGSSSPKGRRGWLGTFTLGVGTGALMLALHSGFTTSAMAQKINLDSAESDWKQVKDVLLSLSVKDRRGYYRTSGSVSLDDIPVWRPTEDASGQTRYLRNEKLDQKISVYSGDITKLEIDAIVNAANKSLLGGGGVDGAIHRAAGPLLKSECASLHGCETGEAKITCGYGLPAKYVIHTVGPIAQGGVGEDERRALRSCYRNSLLVATENAARSVAFPSISTGIYGYPPEQAVHEALAAVREFLGAHHDKLDRVIFCVFLPTDKELYLQNLQLYFPPA